MGVDQGERDRPDSKRSAPVKPTIEAKVSWSGAVAFPVFQAALPGASTTDARINWDNRHPGGGFGATLFISQILSAWACRPIRSKSTANKITPVMITGMLFLFFPFPAGVLSYMVVANISRAADLLAHLAKPAG